MFSERPALHRYPGSMARRVHDMSRVLVEEYGGKADRVWRDVASGTELVARLKALPGFGEQKAKIFAALLGKQLGVRPDGWQEATSPYGDDGSFRSVADILDPETLNRVRAFKQDLKADRPRPRRKAKAGRAKRDRRRRRAGHASPAAGSTCAHPTGPTSRRSSRPAWPAGSTSSSSATSTSTPARWWHGPGWPGGCAAAHGVPCILNDRPDLALDAERGRRPRRPGRRRRRRSPVGSWARGPDRGPVHPRPRRARRQRRRAGRLRVGRAGRADAHQAGPGRHRRRLRGLCRRAGRDGPSS